MQKPHAVLITGSNDRVGLALTCKSLSLGFSVVAHYHTSIEPLNQWLLKRPSLQKRVFFVKTDFASRHIDLLEQAQTLPVQLIGLVNNVAEFSTGNLIDSDHFERVCSINSFAPLHLAREFYSRFTQGWIINILDANIHKLSVLYQNYRISKLFLAELTRQCAFSFAPRIRVNAIAPGVLLPSPKSELNSYQNLVKQAPLKNIGLMKSFFSAYEYLIRTDHVTGQILYIDNGMHIVDQ